jgi:hypothetical protein
MIWIPLSIFWPSRVWIASERSFFCSKVNSSWFSISTIPGGKASVRIRTWRENYGGRTVLIAVFAIVTPDIHIVIISGARLDFREVLPLVIEEPL